MIWEKKANSYFLLMEKQDTAQTLISSSSLSSNAIPKPTSTCIPLGMYRSVEWNNATTPRMLSGMRTI